MNCFQIVKTVLDEIYAVIPGATDAIRDQKVQQALKYLRGRYSNLLKDAQPIDYADPVNRFAYVYSYVTCHANLVATRIGSMKAISTLFNAPKINMACIGGGPGSDFLGVLKFMMNAYKSTSVKCYLLDRDEQWGATWSDIDDKIDPEFRISTYFQRVDVTEPSSTIIASKCFQQSDLFTLTYFTRV